MYKNHKLLQYIMMLLVAIIVYILEVDYYTIASEIVTLISIALAIYFAAIGALCGGASLANKMKFTPDAKYSDRSELGVIISYLKNSITYGIIAIAISIIILVIHDNKWVDSLYIVESGKTIGLKIGYRIMNSVAFAAVSSNFFFIGIISKLVMNRLLLNE